ncbi:MAG: zinc-dependent peptidase, partial [Polyangiales bacterium]
GTNEAEFFAVASEVFFEKPKRLQKEIPELDGLLRNFYNLDLAAR